MPPAPHAAAKKLPATTRVMTPEMTGRAISSRSFFSTSQLARSSRKARSIRSMEPPSVLCGHGIPGPDAGPRLEGGSGQRRSVLQPLEEASPDRPMDRVRRRPRRDEALLAQDLGLDVLR